MGLYFFNWLFRADDRVMIVYRLINIIKLKSLRLLSILYVTVSRMSFYFIFSSSGHSDPMKAVFTNTFYDVFIW